MGKPAPTKEKRNEKLVRLKDEGLTFKLLSAHFDISEARAKEIYYRELKKLGRVPRRYQAQEMKE